MSEWHPGIPEEYRNQVVTGDARELAKRLPDESVDLIICDPPYFRIANKEWDKQWKSIQEYADWCLAWGKEACRVLKKNGSAYIFGDDKNIAYVQVKLDTLDWGLINNIVWSKTNYTMRKASPDALRSYQVQAEERILFYGKDITFPSFSEIVNPQAATPMGEYLRSERKRAGVSMQEIQKLFPSATGGLTGCVSNWELGYNFPLKEQYEKIREYLNNGKYEYLREEYEELREEYEELRRPFFGGKHTDVWVGKLISGSNKTHISEKPKWINDRIILNSSKPDAIILDMFTGSGSALQRIKELSRNYIAFEIDPDTAELARKRVAATNPPLFTLDPQPEQSEMFDEQD